MSTDLDKHLQAVKTALGANDPAVAVLGAVGSLLGAMQEELHQMREKIGSMQAAAATLRIARVRNFFLVFFTGIVLGGAGAGYWMNGHGYMGVFWQHGIKVRTSENSDLLQFQISGPNVQTAQWVPDQNGNVIGVTMTFRKEAKP